MTSNASRHVIGRRTVLGTSCSLAATLGGCSALPGGAGDGTEGYGFRAENHSSGTHDLTLRVQDFEDSDYEDQDLFRDSVTLAPDETHEWDDVLTEEMAYVVIGELNGGDTDHLRDLLQVSVGGSESPDVPNIVAYIMPLGEDGSHGWLYVRASKEPPSIHTVTRESGQ